MRLVTGCELRLELTKLRWSETTLDRFRGFIATESLHPRYAKEVGDDLRKRLQPLGEPLAIQRQKFEALLAQSDGLFFNLVGIACGAKARLNAKYKAITPRSPFAIEKLINSCFDITWIK
jgi:hypothetical protein